MKPEHERVIEAMVGAWFDEPCDDQFSLRMKRALRAAAKEGFVLAKLPEEKEGPEFAPRDRHEHWEVGEVEGWNDCLYEIETITLDKEQDNG